MPRPKPEWHAEAARMRAAGASFPAISKALGKSKTAIRCAIYPEEVRQHYASHRLWVENNRETRRASHRRGSLRAQARAEAAETGEPVEEIYARWGVPTIKRGSKP